MKAEVKAKVSRFNAEQEYFFAEGCFINELYNDPDSPEISIARARLAPGETTRWHVLSGIGERYVILDGAGRVEIGSELSQDVTQGDVVSIPSGKPQRIHNVGPMDLIFLAICTPRFNESAYVDVEMDQSV